MFGRCLERGIHLAVIVATALELPNVVIREVRDHLESSGVTPEEVFSNIGATLRFIGLVIAIWGSVHQIAQSTVVVGLKQRIPFTPPHHLDDVPASAPEETLELLDDFSVATNGPVQALKVAVDDKGEIV